MPGEKKKVSSGSGMGLLYNSEQNPFTQSDIAFGTSNNMFSKGSKRNYDFSGKSSANSFSSKYGSKFNNYSGPNPEKFSKSLETSVSTESLSASGASALGSFVANQSGPPTNDGGEIGENSADAAEDKTADPGKDAKSGMSASAATGAGVKVAGVAASMISGSMEEDAGIQSDNIDQEVNQGKMAGAGAVSGAAKGASMGMAFGPWGAAVGGVVGGAAGYFAGKKKGKEMEGERKRLVKNRNLGRMHEGQAKLSEESNLLAQAAQSRYAMAAKGGKFYIASRRFSLSGKEGKLKKLSSDRFASFRIGGKLNDTHNIIPNGISHDEENSWGTKGQPVVKCKKDSCSKVYEIESEELIITKETTDQLEKLSKKGEEKKLGKYMTEQLLGNTFSYTDSFKEINNEGI